MIADHITNWRRYSLGSAWEKAFEFLTNLDGETKEGEYELEGRDVFSRVMSYTTKDETDDDAVLEAHRKYVDIQMTLDGSERIAVYPIHTLEGKTPYNEANDVAFFRYTENADTQVNVRPGTFVCLFPQDAHMPQLRAGPTKELIKKVVVKIALERLNP